MNSVSRWTVVALSAGALCLQLGCSQTRVEQPDAPYPVPIAVTAGLASETPSPEPDEPRSTPVPPPIEAERWMPEQTRDFWHRGGGLWRWTWPETQDYQRIWNTWNSETQHALPLIATVSGVAHDGAEERTFVHRLLVLLPASDGGRLQSIAWPGEDEDRYRVQTLVSPVRLSPGEVATLQAGEPVTLSEGGLTIRPSYAPELPPLHVAAWDDWVYTTTLLGFEPAVYGPVKAGLGHELEAPLFAAAIEELQAGGTQRSAVEALLTSDVSDRSLRWDEVLRLLQDASSPADARLLQRLYARYRPMGRCSMDTRPQEMALQYAALCRENGQLGCFLQLSVRVMADRFDRVAWSSYGERAHHTHVATLRSAAVDPERFLRGLVMGYASSSSEGEIGLWRLGRAIAESEVADRLALQLEALAVDETLDPMNRFRALLVLYNVMRAGDTVDWDHLMALPLSPISRLWLERAQAAG